jgi:hypothetical protein
MLSAMRLHFSVKNIRTDSDSVNLGSNLETGSNSGCQVKQTEQAMRICSLLLG